MVSIWQLCQPLQQRVHQYCSKIDSNFTRESREVRNENEGRIENRAKYSAIHVKIFQTTLQGVFCGKTVTQNVVFKEVL